MTSLLNEDEAIAWSSEYEAALGDIQGRHYCTVIFSIDTRVSARGETKLEAINSCRQKILGNAERLSAVLWKEYVLADQQGHSERKTKALKYLSFLDPQAGSKIKDL